ncbi:MAG: M3 family oligoendopeptidase [Lachnospiraceae bacterium]|nr:M3 family oligoendopeptidase [Lachnospiraceae bacterium]
MKFSQMPYKRVEKESAVKAYEEFIKQMKEAKSGEEAYAVHKKKDDFEGDINSDITLAEIRHGIDTTDEFYEKENDYYDEFLPELSSLQDKYNRALYDSPYRDYLVSKIGYVAFKNLELGFKSFDDKIVPLLQEENALTSRYSKLIANAKIQYKGEEYNLSGIFKYTHSKDREVRKESWKSVNDYFNSVTEEIDEIYDKLVKNRTKQAKELGYKNYVELGYYRMQRNNYDKNQVETFRSQVKKAFVPFVGKIEKDIADRLGLDKLTLYDLGMYFKEGNPSLICDDEQVLLAGRKMYEELSPETGEFMDFMTDNELFDIKARKTKEQGGYMTFIPRYKSPFIFGSFTGTFDDVGLITHECGHAFQGYLKRNVEVSEHASLTMETAEIHSMSMEYFTYKWMDLFFGKDEDRYKKTHFEDSCIFVPYGCMVDEFQHIVYEKPEMTPAERKAVWKELEKEYRPCIDQSELDFFENGGYWQRQSHIFSSPFYYIDYVLASVCAMQFKVLMDKDYKDAWKKYLVVCEEAGLKYFTEILEDAGLLSPFKDGTIEKLVEELGKKL